MDKTFIFDTPSLAIQPFQVFQPKVFRQLAEVESEDKPVAQVLDAIHARLVSPCVELYQKNIKFKSGSEAEVKGKKVFDVQNGDFGIWYEPAIDISGPKRFIEIVNSDKNDTLLYQKFVQSMKSKGDNDLRLFAAREGILQYLFCYARYELDRKTDENILFTITDESGGGIRKKLLNFILLKAILKIIEENGYNLSEQDVTGTLIPSIDVKNLKFTSGGFTQKVTDAIKSFLYFKVQNQLLEDEDIELFDITPKEKRKLLVTFKEKGITQKSEAQKLLPYLLNNLRAHQNEPEPIDVTEADENDFFVASYDDSATTVTIEKQNIYCAAQLYFVMNFGEELNLFNLMDRIMDTYPIDFRSRQLQRDVQLFRENNQVLDLRNGQAYFRTQEERRHALYNMVFNDEFNSRLEIFLEKIAEYYSKMESRDSGYVYLSRHEILQAAEELQYFISSNCVGIAKILTPASYREMDFIIRRFLQNQEISTQVAPLGNGSFFKVIEEAWLRTSNEKINARNYYQRAEFGKELLKLCAETNTATINDDNFFEKLVSIGKSLITFSNEIDHTDRTQGGIPYRQGGGDTNGIGDMIDGFIPKDNADDDNW